jgi:hypothetical protein
MEHKPFFFFKKGTRKNMHHERQRGSKPRAGIRGEQRGDIVRKHSSLLLLLLLQLLLLGLRRWHLRSDGLAPAPAARNRRRALLASHFREPPLFLPHVPRSPGTGTIVL